MDNPATVASSGTIRVDWTNSFHAALLGTNTFPLTVTDLGKVENVGSQGIGINLGDGRLVFDGHNGSAVTDPDRVRGSRGVAATGAAADRSRACGLGIELPPHGAVVHGTRAAIAGYIRAALVAPAGALANPPALAAAAVKSGFGLRAASPDIKPPPLAGDISRRLAAGQTNTITARPPRRDGIGSRAPQSGAAITAPDSGMAAVSGPALSTQLTSSPTGASGQTGTSGTTTATVSVTGSGLVFNDTFTAHVSAAFENDIIEAEQAFASLWTNPVTVDLTFDAQASPGGGFLASNSFFIVSVTYRQLVDALTAHAFSSYAKAAVASLPTSDPNPAGGADWSLPVPYARMLGLIANAPSPKDDTVTLNTAYQWTYGQDVINTVEHEISEGTMGRIGGLGDQNGIWSTMDLFRYSAPGRRDYSDGRDKLPTYFSYDGTHLSKPLSFNNEYSGTVKVNGDDTADFTEPDVFGTGYPRETFTLSAIDIEVMDVLGWAPAAGAPAALLSGTYTAGVVLSNPTTQNPATLTAAGYVTNKTTSHNGDALYGAVGVAWTVAAYGTIKATGAAAAGVRFGQPGSGSAGAYVGGTVTNTAAIIALGSAGIGIALGAGGKVVNGASGAARGVVAGNTGVEVYRNRGTVSNDATISGVAGRGVRLENGGMIGNAGTISGAGGGVEIDSYGGAAGLVINSGAIAATGTGYGVLFATGVTGSIGNAGLIAAADGAGVLIAGGGSVANTGTIVTASGAGGAGVRLGGGTVINLGAIEAPSARAGAAVAIGAVGGKIVNGQSGSAIGLITGDHDGIALLPGATASPSVLSVVNYGRIESTQMGPAAASGAAGFAIDAGAGGAALVDNFGTIAGSDTGGGALRLTAGQITNNAVIDGAGGGAVAGLPAGAAVTVSNFGTIRNSSSIAADLYFGAGGRVANAAGALIDGAQTTAIRFADTTGTGVSIGDVANAGTILQTGSGGGAVYFGQGGALVNQQTGFVASNAVGVSLNGSAGTLVNFGAVAHIGTGSAGEAVHLTAGGLVTNYGLIAGSGAGTPVSGTTGGYPGVIEADKLATTIVNLGNIVNPNNGNGVDLHGGGRLVNGAAGATAATIDAPHTAVYIGRALGAPIPGALGIIVNYGAVENTTRLGPAVQFVSGGTVINRGLIASPLTGIVSGFAAATIDNFGRIASSAPISLGAGAGAYLPAGGVFANEAGGLITALRSAVMLGGTTGAAGVVTNRGTIAGSTGISLANADDTIVNFGTVSGSGAAGAGVFLLAGGIVANQQGGLIFSDGLGVDAAGGAATVVNSGTIASIANGNAPAVVLAAGGSLTNAAGGLIAAIGSAIDLGGTAAATVTNSGTLRGGMGVSIDPADVGNNTIINFGTITGTAGIAIRLGSGADAVVIEGGSALHGAIGNLHLGDRFDLPLLAFDSGGSARLGAGNVLQIVTTAGTFQIALDPNQNFASDAFQLSADTSGGTVITLRRAPPGDFDRDARSDVLFHDPSDGDTGYWITDTSGNVTGFHDFGAANTSYAVVGGGNFDGTGPEILFRNASSGDTGHWIIDSSGNVVAFHDFGLSDPSYAVAAVGDFDGSGKDEVLFHNATTGDTGYWVTNTSGNVIAFHDFGAANTSYAVAGAADFDGSGRAEVLFHNPTSGDTGYWVTDSTGRVTGFHDFGAVDPVYAVAGIGEFDGSGKPEILFHDAATGDTGYWVTDNSGKVTGFHDFGFADTSYQVASVGDWDGSGRSEVLFHNPKSGDTGHWVTDTSGNVTAFHDFGIASTAYTIVPS